MLYIRFDNDIPVEASETPPPHGDDRWQHRWNWKSLAQVKKIARLLEATTRRKFIGTDEGSNISPRFDVIELPAIGTPVSRTINGDYYPDGYITKITPSLQIKTDTGHTYYRRKESSRWILAGGSWSLVLGHHSELNPSF